MTSAPSGTLSENIHDGALDDINYRDKDKDVHNVSVETGEVFSAEFTPKNVSTMKGTEKNQVRGDGFTIAQNDLVYEELNGLLGIQRGSESGMEFSDISPNNGYALRGNYRAYLDSMSSYTRENSGKGQQRARFADESKGDRATPGSSPLHASKSLHSFYPYNHSPEVSYNSFSGKMKFICSFGGRILPRPNDRRLRYVGGETRIISIRKNLTYNELVKKTTAICNYPHTIKYQLPGEDLDALISVTSDEDLHNMIEEFHDLEKSSLRLRLFLVPSSDVESLCSYEPMNLQQTDADYQYVVAVNGMLEPGLQRNSSRESLASQISQCGSILDYSQSFQRDTPASFHPFEMRNRANAVNILAPQNPTAHWFNASQSPSKSYMQSPPLSPPTGQFKDLKRSPDVAYNNVACPDGHEFYSPYSVDQPAYDNSYNVGTSGYCYNHPSDAMPLSYYQKENTHLLESNKASKPFRQNHRLKRCMTFQPSYQNDLDSKSSVSKDMPLHSERLIHSRDINLLPRLDFQAKSGYGMHHAISDPQLQCEERYNVTAIDAINPAPLNFSGEKSPSLAIFSSSQELSIQQQEQRDQKQVMTKNEHPKNVKEPEFNKEYTEWGPNSVNWIKQKNPYSAHEGSYFGIKDICTPKAYGGRNSSKPLVSTCNSTTSCRENCNDPNSCWETTSKPQVSENRTFVTPPIIPEYSKSNCREQCHDLNSSAKFFYVRPNETTNEKHDASGTTSTEDGFCLSHELQPSTSQGSGSVGHIATLISTDRSGFCLDLNNPCITDISFPNSASGAAFAQDVAIHGNISNDKLKEENSDRISNQNHDSGDEEFFEFQLSDNSHHCKILDRRILGEDNVNNTPPDAPLSSTTVPRVKNEPSDGLPSLGENREAENVSTKPAYKVM